MADTISMRHEPERSRFAATIGSSTAEAVVEYRQVGERTLDYHRTFTPVELRGRGIAGQLVAYALDHALEHGLLVVPTCPFVAKVVAGEPKYAALVAPSSTGGA